MLLLGVQSHAGHAWGLSFQGRGSYFRLLSAYGFLDEDYIFVESASHAGHMLGSGELLRMRIIFLSIKCVPNGFHLLRIMF